MKPWHIWALLGLAWITYFAVHVLSSPKPSSIDAGSSSPAPGGDAEPSARPDPNELEDRRIVAETPVLIGERLDGKRLRLIFRDGLGNLIRGVVVSLAPDRPFLGPESDQVQIGISGKKGFLDISLEMLRKDSHLLVCRRSGFVPRSLDRPYTSAAYTIVLKRSLSTSLRFLDYSGNAVSDLSVALSQATLAYDRIEQIRQSVPGPRSRTAVFVGKTAASGNVEFHGIPTGRYGVVLLSDSYAIHSGTEDGHINTPTVDKIIRLVPLYAVVARFIGAEVLNVSLSTLTREPSHTADINAMRVGRRLGRRMSYENDYVRVFARTPDQSPKITARVLTKRKGWVKVDLPFESIHEGLRPRIVDLTRFPNIDLLTTAKVTIVDSEGRPLAIPRYQLALRKGRFRWFFRDKQGVFHVPVGEYSLWTDMKAINDELTGKRITIRKGIENESRFLLSKPVRYTVLTCRNVQGMTPEFVQIVVTGVDNKFEASYSKHRMDFISLLLPFGEFDIVLRATGYQPAHERIRIDSGYPQTPPPASNIVLQHLAR